MKILFKFSACKLHTRADSFTGDGWLPRQKKVVVLLQQRLHYPPVPDTPTEGHIAKGRADTTVEIGIHFVRYSRLYRLYTYTKYYIEVYFYMILRRTYDIPIRTATAMPGQLAC